MASIATLISLATLYHVYLVAHQDPKTLAKVATRTEDASSNGNSEQEKFSQKRSSNSKNGKFNLSLKLEEPKATVELSRSFCEQLVLSFSVIHNTGKLLGSSGDPAAASGLGHLSSISLLFTFGLFASQAFSFGLLVTPQLLRNWVQTVPYQMLTSDRYWFVRVPSLWVDGLVCLLGVAIVLRQFALLRSKRNSEFGYFAYLFGRWCTLSAAMFGALMLLFLLPLLGDGPFWYLNTNWLWPACTRSSSLVASFLYYSNWNPTFSDYTINDEFSVVSVGAFPRAGGGTRPLKSSNP